jgi:TonB family protein
MRRSCYKEKNNKPLLIFFHKLPIHRSGDTSPPVPALNFTRRIPCPATSRPARAAAAKSFPVTLALLQLALLLAAFAAALPLHAADNLPAPAPRAIKQRVAPQYPEIARRMHVAGVVKIEATVNANGTVASTRTIAGNRMLATAAEDAVHLWRFVPAAESSTVEVEVNFAQNR